LYARDRQMLPFFSSFTTVDHEWINLVLSFVPECCVR